MYLIIKATYPNGTNLLQTLTMPNNMILTQGFEEKRDLLTQMTYKRGNTLVSQGVYTYDEIHINMNEVEINVRIDGI